MKPASRAPSAEKPPESLSSLTPSTPRQPSDPLTPSTSNKSFAEVVTAGSQFLFNDVDVPELKSLTPSSGKEFIDKFVPAAVSNLPKLDQHPSPTTSERADIHVVVSHPTTTLKQLTKEETIYRRHHNNFNKERELMKEVAVAFMHALVPCYDPFLEDILPPLPNLSVKLSFVVHPKTKEFLLTQIGKMIVILPGIQVRLFDPNALPLYLITSSTSLTSGDEIQTTLQQSGCKVENLQRVSLSTWTQSSSKFWKANLKLPPPHKQMIIATENFSISVLPNKCSLKEGIMALKNASKSDESTAVEIPNTSLQQTSSPVERSAELDPSLSLMSTPTTMPTEATDNVTPTASPPTTPPRDRQKSQGKRPRPQPTIQEEVTQPSSTSFNSPPSKNKKKGSTVMNISSYFRSNHDRAIDNSNIATNSQTGNASDNRIGTEESDVDDDEHHF